MNLRKNIFAELIFLFLNFAIISRYFTSATKTDVRNEIPTLDDIIAANVNSNGTWKIPPKNNDQAKEKQLSNAIEEDKYNDLDIGNKRLFDLKVKKKQTESNLIHDENYVDEQLKRYEKSEGGLKMFIRNQNPSLEDNDAEDVASNKIDINANNERSPFSKGTTGNLTPPPIPSLDDILDENIHSNGTWKDYEGPAEVTIRSLRNRDISNFDYVKTTVEEVDYDLRDEIVRNLPNLIREGVKNAEKVLDDNRKALENMLKMGKKPVNHQSSHARIIQPESRDVGYCRGLATIETTKLIVEKYNLTKTKIPAMLSSINIEPLLANFRTKYCQEVTRQIVNSRCDPNFPYRTITGQCNNLNPAFINRGASNTPLARFLNPQYGDGFNSMRGDNLINTPFALPNPRAVSRSLNLLLDPSPDIHMTQMLKAYGQITDHDLTFTLEGEGRCCDFGFEDPTVSPFSDCRPIDVRQDIFFSQFGVRCLRFIRNTPAGPASVLSPREQINTLTSFIDASFVYGSTQAKSNELREFVDGRMKEHVRGEDGTCSSSRHCNMPFLPERPNSTPSLLFNAGDVRVNEQPGLIAMHTMFFRFHNKIAEQLKKKHPTFNDTILFEESRRILIAVEQHITYNEFLPLLIGKDFANDFRLYSAPTLAYSGYNASTDSSIRNAFATAALRIGHTLIGKFISGKKSIVLETAFNRANMMMNDSDMFPSHVIKGECTNPCERYDVEIVEAVVNKLLAVSPFSHGSDLVSLNIQRGRDHGLPPYNDWRRFCRLTPFTSFDHMREQLNPAAVDVFQRLYRSVNDVDLFPGAISEFRTTFGFIGETLSCILASQFSVIKHGDRFWYENKNQPKPFTADQLAVIKNTSLASVICTATSITTIQPFPMLTSKLTKNEERKCSDFLQGSVISKIAQFW